tara:strand:+ start:641 stop:2320 length:1680 start_codon:yes stop_codon:yes gene_type:complete
MKKIVKILNNLIKKIIFKVLNKTNNFVKNLHNLIKNTIFKVQNKINNFVKNFNNLIKNTIFKVLNKTNNFVKNLHNLIKKTIFKVWNKTNNKYQISNFNKFLITFISLLFFYLFYLSIPVLYDKNYVQNKIENQLLKEFKINFSTSSQISYRILPKPHFLLKDAKIFKEEEKTALLAEIKNLRVFIFQKNFFKKEKIIVKNVKIDNANFLLSKKVFKLLNDSSKNKFSNKHIEINNSNIFLKNDSAEVISIVKLSKADLFFDSKRFLNLFNLKGEVFKIPFNFNFKKNFDLLKNEEINIDAKSLKLKIFNESGKEKNKIANGKNIISTFNSKFSTKYKIIDDIIVFESDNSRINNSKIYYSGEFSINPFNLESTINLGNYKISKLLSLNNIWIDFMKTKLLYNDNISANVSLIATSTSKNEIFQYAKINFDFSNGKIKLDNTKLINKKIGFIELENSNLFIKDDNLILNADFLININSSDELFSTLQTSKKSRKLIKKILINLDYNFLTKQINFNNVKIDNKEVNDKLLRIIDGLNDNNINNLNKSRGILNELFEAYDG